MYLVQYGFLNLLYLPVGGSHFRLFQSLHFAFIATSERTVFFNHTFVDIPFLSYYPILQPPPPVEYSCIAETQGIEP